MQTRNLQTIMTTSSHSCPPSAHRRATLRPGRLATASLLCAVVLPALAGEEQLAIELTKWVPAVNTNLVNGTDGFEFIPNENLLVAELRWYDHNGDGLLHSHPVGIFETSSRTLLASATIDSSDPLDPETNFRFERLGTPLLLRAGVSYTVSGNGAGPNFDHYLRCERAPGSVAVDPLLRFVRYRSLRISGRETDPVFPSFQHGTSPDSIWLGANFSFLPVPPPPSAPRVSSVGVDPVASSVTIRWTSQTGATYAVERSENLLDWEVVANEVPGASSYSLYRDESLAALPPQLYYRVRLLE